MGVWLRKSSHRFHGFAQMVGCVNSPTEFTEFTEVLLRRSSHGIHRSFVALIRPRNSQKFCCVNSPTEFTEFTEVLLRRSSHRIHRSFVASVLPQNSQKFCCVSPPTDFTDLHRWLGCVCAPTEFTEFTEVRLHKSSHRFHGFAQMAWLRLFSHISIYWIPEAAWVWQDAIPS